MKLKIFSIYDSKVSAFGTPFFQRSTGEAVRAFTDAVNRKDSDNGFAMHPEDYTLFELGSWDDAMASVDMMDSPKSLGVAVQFKVEVKS